MGKRIVLFATVEVVPFEAPEEKEEGKQLVFIDSESGETILYPMSDKLARKIGTKLRMSNAALMGELQAEARRAEAQQTLGLNGTSPETELREILKKQEEEGG